MKTNSRARPRTSFGGRLRGRNKYGAIKVKADGYTFDSKMEQRHYQTLVALEKTDKIICLMVHPRYPIEIRGKKICDVVLDFRYQEFLTGMLHIVDVKGRDNALSKLKRKMVEAEYGIKVELITK